MRLCSVGRRPGAALAVTAVVVSLLGAAPSARAASDGMLFTGGGRGPSADVAIRRAIDDATTSASAYQLYTCTLVGEPQVFESTNDPNFGHVPCRGDRVLHAIAAGSTPSTTGSKHDRRGLGGAIERQHSTRATRVR
jgi:hypothetical protein